MNRRSFFSGSVFGAVASLFGFTGKADAAKPNKLTTVLHPPGDLIWIDSSGVFHAVRYGDIARMIFEGCETSGVLAKYPVTITCHGDGRVEIIPGSAMQRLTQQLQSDPEYAWSWHCNLAIASIDEGLHWAAANRAAARFMQSAFGVDMTKSPHWPTGLTTGASPQT